MSVEMHYIREKNNPLNIISYGYVESTGGLGDFDNSIYEEVIGNLPSNFVMKDMSVATPAPTDTTASNPTNTTTSNPPDVTDAELQQQLKLLLAQLKARGLLGL